MFPRTFQTAQSSGPPVRPRLPIVTDGNGHHPPSAPHPQSGAVPTSAPQPQAWYGEFHQEGLPDDDDPLLQRRLQQVVQEHKPQDSVLRELAEVAEQQQHPPKARKQMNDLKTRQAACQQAIATLEKEQEQTQKMLQREREQLQLLDKQLADAAENLCDELLKEKSAWNHMYWHLVNFHKKNGHLRVPWKKEEKDRDPVIGKLGPWLVSQRKNYRRPLDDPERLEQYKIAALERLDIDWEPYKTHWMNRFEALKSFQDEHGHCRVPYCSGRKRPRDGTETSKVTYDSLGVWVKRQRHQYKLMQSGAMDKAGDMTEDRIKLLDSIGFEWSLRSNTDKDTWKDRYDQLKKFKEENGHTRVDDKDKLLYDWVKSMRGLMERHAEGNESGLNDKQYLLLKELDLEQSLRKSKLDQRLQDLADFKKKHGHCIVPSNYPLNTKLANWVMTQKRQYKLLRDGKKSQLTESKVKFLKEAGFEFEVSKERKSETMKQLSKSWEEFFAELEQYKLKFGEVNQITQKKRQRLREWCEEQRVQAARRKWGKYSQITDDQIERLSQLGFKWDTVDSPSKGWDDYYGELLIHFLNTRSWSIPNNLGNLGQWIDQQRTEYKKFLRGVPSLLTSGQIKKLDSVHFPWLTNRDSKLPSKSWEEMFGELLADKVKHGHNRSNDSKNVELYNWKVRQRQDRMNIEKKYKKRSAVFEERIRKLDEVGFDWNGPKVQLTKGGARRRMPLQESATGASAMTPVAPMPMGGPAFVGPWTGHGPFVRPVGIPIVPVPKGHQAIMPTQPAGQMVGQAAAAAAFVVAQNPKDLANQAAKVVADLNARNKETPEEGHETASDQKIQAALNE